MCGATVDGQLSISCLKYHVLCHGSSGIQGGNSDVVKRIYVTKKEVLAVIKHVKEDKSLEAD